MAARTIATNRRLVGVTASMLSSSTVDATGLLCTLTFDRAVTAASGNPYATPLAYTSGGSLINLNYVSGSGTNSWQYAITNGNPSGSPVLAGSTVLANIGAGVFVGGGVGNAAVSGGSVTNNSTVQNVGNFVRASSKSLSIASNATVQTGNINWWLSAEFNIASIGLNEVIVAKASDPSNYEFTLFVRSTGTVRFATYNTNASNEIDADSAVITAAAWHHVFVWRDTTAGTVNISIDAGTPVSTAYGAQAPAAGTGQWSIGGRADPSLNDLYFTGMVRNVCQGKNLPGGFATTAATTIRNALYAGGSGLRPSAISSANRTAWGVVIGSIDTSLTADVIGSNTLTNNNTVTLTTEQF